MMIDNFGRKIEYLRLSVTDLCNLRCIYCMDENGVYKKNHFDILSIEEMTDIIKCSYELGIKKVRLTGGEPLLRRGIFALCENIKNIDENIELTVTTNGTMLEKFAKPLKDSGVDRLNISLDTLDKEKYKQITRIGNIDDVINGIKKASEVGFKNTKINTVLLGNINTNEIKALAELTKTQDICVRFIELMPMNICKDWNKERFVSASIVTDVIKNLVYIGNIGVSKLYKIEGYKGSIGLISPMSHAFCDKCNKIRVTADGKLKTCLHSAEEVTLKGLPHNELKQAIKTAILDKPMKHNLYLFKSETNRNMNEIGG